MPVRAGLRHLALAACALVCACSTSETEPQAEAPPCADEAELVSIHTEEEIRAMRTEGPEALARLLTEYDAAEGAERERLAKVVDRVAGQRYATVSRMYWYTKLEAAQAAARASGKPILSLRMLGRLDEDLSCANSRFFRVALYANAELSAWLRDSFVLHWSSERPVPKLSIDYGDGRRIETTIAGNSAHWVLDADGRVLDVVPGLMTPHAFRGELDGALALARRLGREAHDDATRDRMLAAHHRALLDAGFREWQTLGVIPLPESGEATLASAEMRTMSKARIEIPVVTVASLGPDPRSIPAQSEAWHAIGVGLLAARGLPTADTAVLDARARGLMTALHPIDWASAAPLDEIGRNALAVTFTRSIVADSGLNLTRLRMRIHAELVARTEAGTAHDFAAMNRWVYAALFLTPADDRWLGLATPGLFTGLPGDGVTTAG